jgi:putative Mg2+ transporter-C (MgtC) family protein
MSMMDMVAFGPDEIVITVRIVASLAVGAGIGLERSLHARPAGFRTHALVCLASTLLMLVTVYQDTWMTHVSPDAIRTDPTRMAQGIMTGIGFLGAGVIFKEGLNVRGLTTAASIWITSAIGILIGIGFYFAALLGGLFTLAVLAVFRMIEDRLPSEYYAHHLVGFKRDAAMSESELRQAIGQYGFVISGLSSRLTGSDVFEYRMMIKSRDRDAIDRLSQYLRGLPDVVKFRISPTGS